jgi:NAD(P)-dependent dehydrogenase (short-subunit alcohol dehydrogenase family)
MAKLLDSIFETTVIPSFTRIGPTVRARLDDWRPIDSYDLRGRTVLVTGSSSGLGRHTAKRLAERGARVLMNGRDRAKTERVRAELLAADASLQLEVLIGDMGEIDQVRRIADEVAGLTSRLDALIHNAGALTAERRNNSKGIEATVASQVLGPFLLTSLLLPILEAAEPGRVVTVASGGMYAAPLMVDGLQMPAHAYKGSEQYARAKRAQVVLNEMWSARVPADKVAFHAMHPGWADTPGVKDSLPVFRLLTKPLLRNLEQGADTVLWLVADDAGRTSSGKFWLDREPRATHKLRRTRASDTAERRARLWEWCAKTSGAEVPPSTV